MSLKDRLRAEIAATGPISVAEFMARCLHDPQDGYYARHPRLGADGDFITAPLVSQMFGELLGLWAIEVWDRLGRPAPFRLVEMGPGDGTLITDALRAARLVPEFLQAAELWLVETSAPLRALQAQAIAPSGREATWVPSFGDVPAGAPLILVANELLDCLPARQFVRTPQGWAERRVGLDSEGELTFGLAPAPSGFLPPPGLETSPPGSIIEISPAQEALGRAVGERIACDGGAALFSDYGRARAEPGDTLQGLRAHRKLDPLEAPGDCDLTVHADFPAFATAARAGKAAVTAIRTQAAFLQALGIEQRAAALARARPDRAEVIARQLERLIAPDQMGDLFKVVGVHTPGLAMPGFE